MEGRPLKGKRQLGDLNTQPEAFRAFEYPTPPERPSATFIEDAYRRAVAATLGDLSGEEPAT